MSICPERLAASDGLAHTAKGWNMGAPKHARQELDQEASAVPVAPPQGGTPVPPDMNDLTDANVPAAPPHKRHRLCDHRVLFIVVAALLIIIGMNLITIIPVLAGVDIQSTDGQVLGAVIQCVVSLVALLVYQLKFREEFDGVFGWSTTGLVLALPAAAYFVTNLFDFESMSFMWDIASVNPPLASLVIAAAPGISEEVMFRNLPISNWLRVRCERRDVISIAIITSVLFGCVHALNALVGANVGSTVFQVFYACALGIMFAAVFLRCGSIWPTMIMHTLLDFTAFLFMDLSKSGLITSELTIGLAFYVTVAISIAAAAWGIYLLRPSKLDEVVALWNAKWHKA